MEESIVERVLVLIKDYGLTASEFADKIDVQRSSMSHLVSGRNKPSLDFIQKILNNFSDINPTWLIMGSGPMKQLDLFDIKGDIAPTEPLPAKQDKIDDSNSIDAGEQKSIKQTYQVEAEPAVLPLPIQPVQIQVPVEEAYTTPITQTVAQPIIQAPVQQVIAPPAPITPAIQTQPVVLAQTTEPLPAQPTVPQNSPIQAKEMYIPAEKSVQNDKKVTKIVFFYSDNSFESFNPQ